MNLMDRPSSRCTRRQWCNGRITQIHLLKLNGGVPRMSFGSSFQGDLLYMAAKLLKKAWGNIYTHFYTRGNVWLMTWAMAVPPYGHSFWHILCHHALTSVHDVLAWKCGQKPHHRNNVGCVAKTGGLGSMLTSAKGSAVIYRRITITYIKKEQGWNTFEFFCK